MRKRAKSGHRGGFRVLGKTEKTSKFTTFRETEKTSKFTTFPGFPGPGQKCHSGPDLKLVFGKSDCFGQNNHCFWQK